MLNLGVRRSLIRGPVAASGPAPVAYQAESYPATIALAHNIQSTGDSRETGVSTYTGGGTDRSYMGRLATLLTAGTITRRGVAGAAYTVGAPTSIQAQVALETGGQLANDTQVMLADVNQYSTTVNPDPAAQTWVADALASLSGTIRPAFTGLPAQKHDLLIGMSEDVSGPGMQHWSSMRQFVDAARAAYGADAIDIHRYLQWKALPTNVNDLDYIAIEEFWGLARTARGHNSGTVNQLLFAKTVETVVDVVTTATNTPAGIQAQLAANTRVEGNLVQNNGAVGGNNMFRVSTNGDWQGVDDKHTSLHANLHIVDFLLKDLDAIQGGCPNPIPGTELRCKQDAAAGTACGTIYYSGAAPATLALFLAGVQVTDFTLVDNGSTNSRGSISVTRAATGTLVEDHFQFEIQLTNGAGGVKKTPVDLYVGKPASQTSPVMRTSPNSTGANSSLADMSMFGEEVPGYSDGTQFSCFGWLNPSDLTLQPYLVHHSRRSGNGNIFISITNAGSLSFLVKNEANTILMTKTIANVFTQGQSTFFAVEFDVSTATTTAAGVYSKNGGADVNMAFGTLAVGLSTLGASKYVPRFFSIKDASIANRWFTTPDAARNQYRGGCGFLAFGNGLIGIGANAAVVRALWGSATGVPAAREPYDPVGTFTPTYEFWPNKGQMLGGGFNLARRLYMTRRAMRGIT